MYQTKNVQKEKCSSLRHLGVLKVNLINIRKLIHYEAITIRDKALFSSHFCSIYKK